MKFFRYFIYCFFFYIVSFVNLYSKELEDTIPDWELEQVIERANAITSFNKSDRAIVSFYELQKIRLTTGQVIRLMNAVNNSSIQDSILEDYSTLKTNSLTTSECISLSKATRTNTAQDLILKTFAENNIARLTHDDLLALSNAANTAKATNYILELNPGIKARPTVKAVESTDNRRNLIKRLHSLYADEKAARNIRFDQSNGKSLLVKNNIALILSKISTLLAQLRWWKWSFYRSNRKIEITNSVKNLELDLSTSIRTLQSEEKEVLSLVNNKSITGKGALLILNNTPPNNELRRAIATLLAKNPGITIELTEPAILDRQINQSIPSYYQLKFEINILKDGAPVKTHHLLLWIHSKSTEDSLINEMVAGNWINQLGEENEFDQTPNKVSLRTAAEFIQTSLLTAPPTGASPNCAVEVKKIEDSGQK